MPKQKRSQRSVRNRWKSTCPNHTIPAAGKVLAIMAAAKSGQPVSRISKAVVQHPIGLQNAFTAWA